MPASDDLIRRSTTWQRVADGLQMMVFGVFLLLTTLGDLRWSFWIEAVSLWPFLIVGVGLRMIFERSRAPWAMVLYPLLIAGALTWLARYGPPDVKRRSTTYDIARPDSVGTLRLLVKEPLGRFAIQARPLADDVLLQGVSWSRAGDESVETRLAEGETTLILRGPRDRTWSWLKGPGAASRWDLRAAADLPISVVVDGPGIHAALDLRGGTLEGARATGAFNEVEIHLPAPRRETRIEVHGAFNAASLTVPTGVAVALSASGPLNSLDEPIRGKDPGYVVRVNGVMNQVRLTVESAP